MIARRTLTVMILAGCAAGATACGSSSTPNRSAAKASRSEFLAFSVCMRSHGVPTFPDPGPNGGLQVTGLNTRSPAFHSANQTCAHLLPAGGTGRPTPSNERRLLALAECVRRHGAPNFPDPKVFAGGVPPVTSIVIDGYEFKLGAGLNPGSPTFRRAMSACSASAKI